MTALSVLAMTGIGSLTGVFIGLSGLGTPDLSIRLVKKIDPDAHRESGERRRI